METTETKEMNFLQTKKGKMTLLALLLILIIAIVAAILAGGGKKGLPHHKHL